MMKKDSPALRFIRIIWNSHGDKMQHSWNRLNEALQDATRLAVRCGLLFHIDDFAIISMEFRSRFWMGTPPEGIYSLACNFPHMRNRYGRYYAENPTACRSYENWKGRSPFIWGGSRLCVGAQFEWNNILLTVTSFNDERDQFVACTYTQAEHRTVIAKRITFTRERFLEDRKACGKN